MDERTQLIERELEALYQVSQVLNRPLGLKAKLEGILEILQDCAGMRSGMLALREQEGDALEVCSVLRSDGAKIEKPVRYEPGEGLMGTILDAGRTIVVERIADEPRFLGKLGLYDPALPFIGSPIRVGDHDLVGVPAAQPVDRQWLDVRARFLEMVANLIAQSIDLLRGMERKQLDLAAERDQLKQSLRRNYGFDNIVGRSPQCSGSSNWSDKSRNGTQPC